MSEVAKQSGWFEAFKKAWLDYPSQDNEGYVPDRGGFKAGFHSAWHMRDEEVNKLKQDLALALSDASIKHKYRADVLERRNDELTNRLIICEATLNEVSERYDAVMIASRMHGKICLGCSGVARHSSDCWIDNALAKWKPTRVQRCVHGIHGTDCFECHKPSGAV